MSTGLKIFAYSVGIVSHYTYTTYQNKIKMNQWIEYKNNTILGGVIITNTKNNVFPINAYYLNAIENDKFNDHPNDIRKLASYGLMLFYVMELVILLIIILDRLINLIIMKRLLN